MTNGEWAHIILSGSSSEYFFVLTEKDGGQYVGMSNSKFARSILAGLEDAINRAEHHEKKAVERAEKASRPQPASNSEPE